MPNAFQRLPSTLGIPQEFIPPPTQSHRSIPVEQKKESTGRRRLGLDRLSVRNHVPDFNRIFKVMFGREADVDDATGQLVFRKQRPPTGFTLGAAQDAPANPQQPMLDWLASHNDYGSDT